MNDVSYWCVFFSAALALNLAPGPDLMYVLSRTVTQGTRVGLASAAGVSTGALVHVAAASFGLSAILATSAVAFMLVKYIGACYLFYLGIQALRSGGTTFERKNRDSRIIRPWQAFRQGILIDVLNPKVAIFFMAFLPQFVRPGHGSVSLQLLVLGLLVIGTAIVVDSFFVLAAARTTGYFRQHPRASLWLDRFLGSIFIGLGIRLALAEHRS
ncbi:MAG: LysE family translocator [Desulfobulbus sp.]|nr:LysE family translocator [Desulfobulbus sp.]